MKSAHDRPSWREVGELRAVHPRMDASAKIMTEDAKCTSLGKIDEKVLLEFRIEN
jgi:hypothetical protein